MSGESLFFVVVPTLCWVANNIDAPTTVPKDVSSGRLP